MQLIFHYFGNFKVIYFSHFETLHSNSNIQSNEILIIYRAHEQVLPQLVQILLTLNVDRLAIYFAVWFATSLLRFTVFEFKQVPLYLTDFTIET